MNFFKRLGIGKSKVKARRAFSRKAYLDWYRRIAEAVKAYEPEPLYRIRYFEDRSRWFCEQAFAYQDRKYLIVNGQSYHISNYFTDSEDTYRYNCYYDPEPAEYQAEDFIKAQPNITVKWQIFGNQYVGSESGFYTSEQAMDWLIGHIKAKKGTIYLDKNGKVAEQ